MNDTEEEEKKKISKIESIIILIVLVSFGILPALLMITGVV
jgi:hypothetical protein